MVVWALLFNVHASADSCVSRQLFMDIDRPLVITTRTSFGETTVINEATDTVTSLNDNGYTLESKMNSTVSVAGSVTERHSSGSTRKSTFYEPITDVAKIAAEVTLHHSSSIGLADSEMAISYKPFSMTAPKTVCVGQTYINTYDVTSEAETGEVESKTTTSTWESEVLGINEVISTPAGDFNTIHWATRAYNQDDASPDAKHEIWRDIVTNTVIKSKVSGEVDDRVKVELISLTY